MTISSKCEVNQLPQHVAIIMDGNGRWAKKQGKIRLLGHRAGVNAVRESVSFAVSKGIKRLTLFAFSSENWQRPEAEVTGLMELFTWALSNEVKNLHKNNIKLRVIGDITRFSEKLRNSINSAIELTASNSGLILNIAVNYGGRWDIVNSIQKIIEANNGNIKAQMISQDLIKENLSESEDVDLLIRTGGERRISNFLLWQLAYSEIFISDVLWPDFSKEVFAEALDYFLKRERRFGCTGEQIRQSR
jgi:undecaprenyl diphosphate synthase